MAIQSLFGPSPPEIQELRRQQEEKEILASGGQFGAFAPLYQAGLRFGSAGQKAMAPLLGTQDPMLQKATAIQGVLAKYQGQDINSAEVMSSIASDLSSVDMEAGLRAAEMARKMVKEVDPDKVAKSNILRIAQIPSEDRTTEEQRLYDASQAALGRGETGRYKTLTPEEIRKRGLNPDIQYQEDLNTGKLSQIGQSPAVIFKAPLVGAQKEYAQVVGKATADRDVKQFESAETAVNNLEKINTTLTELKNSDAITGLGSEILTNVERFKKFVTDSKKAGKKISDTEYLDALLGSDVFPMIGALGIGARGLDTVPEREFLRQVMTGSLKMDRNTLIRLTELRKTLEERSIKRYNDRVKKGEYNEFFKLQGREPVTFSLPTAPGVSDQDLINKYLTR
jgi:hypothetical protein